MKIWTDTLAPAALVMLAAFSLGACDTNAPPDAAHIDEVLELIQEIEVTAKGLGFDEETGAIYELTEVRLLHPSTDMAEIRRIARSQGLTGLETDLLVKKMEAEGDPVPPQVEKELVAGPNAEVAKSLQRGRRPSK